MKKIINILSFISAFVSSLLIICTFLTTYQFYYVGQIFNSYFPIQIGVFMSMSMLSLRFLVNETGNRRILYSSISFLISLITLYFMTNLIN